MFTRFVCQRHRKPSLNRLRTVDANKKRNGHAQMDTKINLTVDFMFLLEFSDEADTVTKTQFEIPLI